MALRKEKKHIKYNTFLSTLVVIHTHIRQPHHALICVYIYSVCYLFYFIHCFFACIAKRCKYCIVWNEFNLKKWERLGIQGGNHFCDIKYITGWKCEVTGDGCVTSLYIHLLPIKMLQQATEITALITMFREYVTMVSNHPSWYFTKRRKIRLSSFSYIWGAV